VVDQRNLEARNAIVADILRGASPAAYTVTHATLASRCAFLRQLFHAYADIQYTIGEVVSQGNRVAGPASFRRTQQRAPRGCSASGRRVD
jgi:predicted ester cyclase